ncbi:hypothetical protein [Paenarthrobacter nitroguajacolicus]|uniref:hypothetical protein n=1 Tax=Paenarthrobacter nitroguajacolicus TaxID=211146 RepID=UPI0015BE64A3|nr:hypothetical protein [Paenarthrobacter nitroguajacolicus]NWL35120.1 hypothetical protein [Paenarthrobacter nitroguajacolicus]
MKKVLIGAAVLATALTLTACGGTVNKNTPSESAEASDAPITAPTAAPVTTPKSTPTPTGKAKSIRGNFIAELGDIGSFSNQSTKKVTTKFTVDSILDVQCTQPYSRPADNGRLITVALTVETTPDLADDTNPNFRITSHDFKFIAASGTTFNGNLGSVATYSCIDDALTFPSGGMGPAEKVAGSVVLDLPPGPGTLVYTGGAFTGPFFEYPIS